MATASPFRIGALLPTLLAVWCLASPTRAEAKLTPPKLEGFVVDTSGTLSSAARTGVDRELAAFKANTGWSIVVFVTKSLDGDSIEDAAYLVFNTWKIGDATKDNGILLLVAPTEHLIRIETGKGAGGAITDLQANDIIRRMTPLMAESRVDVAVQLAITELQALVRKEVGNDAPTAAPVKRTKRSKTIGLVITFSIVGIVALVLLLTARSRRRASSKQPVTAMGTAKPKLTGFEVITGIAKVLAAIAGRKGSSKGGRGNGSGGGHSGGGGSSGSY